MSNQSLRYGITMKRYARKCLRRLLRWVESTPDTGFAGTNVIYSTGGVICVATITILSAEVPAADCKEAFLRSAAAADGVPVRRCGRGEPSS